MNWLDKLERKIGRYAIHNLMYYIIILYVVGLVVQLFAPSFYYQYLSLDVNAILHGQIWRVVTFIIQPPQSSYIFMIFALYLYYMLGRELERTWGAFRFNLYFFAGMLFHVIAAFAAYFITGVSFPLGTWYLNMSLFLAFAAIYPDMQFYLFFMIPVKAKWLGWLDGLYFLYTIAQAFLPAYGGGGAMFSTVRIVKWAGGREKDGDKVYEYSGLGNATFDLYLSDSQGNRIGGKLDTMTTGLDSTTGKDGE